MILHGTQTSLFLHCWCYHMINTYHMAYRKLVQHKLQQLLAHMHINESKEYIWAPTTTSGAHNTHGYKVWGHSQMQEVLKTTSRVESHQQSQKVFMVASMNLTHDKPLHMALPLYTHPWYLLSTLPEVDKLHNKWKLIVNETLIPS